jgi:hypothetical protein
MKKTLLIIMAAALALWAARYWMVSEPVDVAFLTEAPQGAVPEPEPAFEAETELDELEELDAGMDRLDPSVGAARRIVHVPSDGILATPDEARYDDIREIGEDELEDFTDYNLRQALDGDLGAANRVVHAQRRCADAPSSALEVERQVQSRLGRYQWMAANRNRNRSYPTEAELREQATQQFENCRFMADLFTGDLRRQLEAMANRGHVMARYLYALWPPEIFGQPDAFLRQQEWAEKALSYSLANLTEGEPAGLLAFGQSYANNGTFTARDRYLGTAFIIAALDCGLDLEYYGSYVNQFMNSQRLSQSAGDPRGAVLAMADGLKAFCR